MGILNNWPCFKFFYFVKMVSDCLRTMIDASIQTDGEDFGVCGQIQGSTQLIQQQACLKCHQLDVLCFLCFTDMIK